MFFDFNRERAKFVPMVNVAGKAGGTIIVTRSKARTMITCHGSCKCQRKIGIHLGIDPRLVS